MAKRITVASRERESLEVELTTEGITLRITFGRASLAARLDLATARGLAEDILEMAAQAN